MCFVKLATLLSLGALALLVGDPLAAQGSPGVDERVAALKASLQENQARLRQYEWIETTAIALKGEEKGRRQQRCYYGADGKIQKLPIGDVPAQAAPQGRGGRGGRLRQRIVENKKDEMQDYMERAVNLTHLYVPPNPAAIQQAKDGGKLAVEPSGAGQVRLQFSNYLQAGDAFAIEIDGAANRLSAITLATYLDKPEDPVVLDVQFATLADGTSYVAKTVLDAKAKKIRVTIENSGYRPIAR
jgi:hypothetical protein